MKILSIGNSFSQDAHRYLHKLAKTYGDDFKCVNLCIAGCSLRTHYLNMLANNENYYFEFNGENTGIKVSISQVLASDDWDVVTLQQASWASAKKETYSPYIEKLAEYIRKYCPNSKIYIHQTWAYEDGSERLKVNAGYDSAQKMFFDIQNAYLIAKDLINANGIIPCGEAMLKAIDLGIGKIHRDTLHAALGTGRYLLALTWYKVLTGKDIDNNAFNDFDIPVSKEERAIIIEAVKSVTAKCD